MNDVNIFDADLMDAEKDEEVLDSFHGIFCTLMGGLGFQVQRRPFFLYLETRTSKYFACKLQFFIQKLASSKKHLEPHLELLKPFLKCSFFPSRPPCCPYLRQTI